MSYDTFQYRRHFHFAMRKPSARKQPIPLYVLCLPALQKEESTPIRVILNDVLAGFVTLFSSPVVFVLRVVHFG